MQITVTLKTVKVKVVWRTRTASCVPKCCTLTFDVPIVAKKSTLQINNDGEKIFLKYYIGFFVRELILFIYYTCLSVIMAKLNDICLE